MGRKSTVKSREKRQQRKEEQQRISAAMSIVEKANKLDDPLAPFPVFRQFDKNDLKAELFVRRVHDLEPTTIDWIFELTKKNMQTKYDESSWGWSDCKKREELTDDAAWYLIAKSKMEDEKLLGFSHFRFDIDEGVEVLYCYEVQLETEYQRHGLGKFMMQILELIAFTNQMKKVVLTVLKNNQYSRFFRALNYKLDETSPYDDDEVSYPFEILSKFNKRLMENCVKSTDNNHCCSSHHNH